MKREFFTQSIRSKYHTHNLRKTTTKWQYDSINKKSGNPIFFQNYIFPLFLKNTYKIFRSKPWSKACKKFFAPSLEPLFNLACIILSLQQCKTGIKGEASNLKLLKMSTLAMQISICGLVTISIYSFDFLNPHCSELALGL